MRISNGESIYMEVPQGFWRHYKRNEVLLLKQAIYELVQAAHAFWRLLVKSFYDMGYTRSKADPCLYFAWTTNNGLIMWLSLVDDCVVVGMKEEVLKAKKQMIRRFDCDEAGP